MAFIVHIQVYTSYRNGNIVVPMPVNIKSKLNERKRLLKSNRRFCTRERSERIKQLNKEIKNHFYVNTKNKITRTIIPGNTQSLWKAVKMAKDVNTKELPQEMYRSGQKIADDLYKHN